MSGIERNVNNSAAYMRADRTAARDHENIYIFIVLLKKLSGVNKFI